jgi:uncharacterized membrane protein
MSNKVLILNAILGALYVALVYVFQFASFNAVQFRIAEVLLVLVLFNYNYRYGLVIGTFIVNFLLSPLGIIDGVVGAFATFLTLELMYVMRKHIELAMLVPGVINGLIVGIMLNIVLELPLFESIFFVFLGETVVMLIIGLPVYYVLKSKASHVL